MPADRAVQPVNLHSHIFNFTIERTKEIILEALICLLLCEAAFIDIVLNNIIRMLFIFPLIIIA